MFGGGQASGFTIFSSGTNPNCENSLVRSVNLALLAAQLAFDLQPCGGEAAECGRTNEWRKRIDCAHSSTGGPELLNWASESCTEA